jgi:hypothetical protein
VTKNHKKKEFNMWKLTDQEIIKKISMQIWLGEDNFTGGLNDLAKKTLGFESAKKLKTMPKKGMSHKYNSLVELAFREHKLKDTKFWKKLINSFSSEKIRENLSKIAENLGVKIEKRATTNSSYKRASRKKREEAHNKKKSLISFSTAKEKKTETTQPEKETLKKKFPKEKIPELMDALWDCTSTFGNYTMREDIVQDDYRFSKMKRKIKLNNSTPDEDLLSIVNACLEDPNGITIIWEIVTEMDNYVPAEAVREILRPYK